MNEKITDITFIIRVVMSNVKVLLVSLFIFLTSSIFFSLFSTQQYLSYITLYPSYSSEDFLPSNNFSSAMKNIVGAKFNLGANNSSWGSNSFYIPELVYSKKMKKDLISKQWKTSNEENIRLIELLKIKSNLIVKVKKFFVDIYNPYLNDEKFYEEILIKELENIIYCREEDSGLIIVKVLLPDALVSSNIANYIADFIKKYISFELETNATKFRKDIEKELNNFQEDLINSESILTEFRNNNPIALDNPLKQLQRARLIREVEINQKIFLDLKRQYEIAKYNESKFRPVINILDLSDISYQSSKPSALLLMICAVIFSFFITFLINKSFYKKE